MGLHTTVALYESLILSICKYSTYVCIHITIKCGGLDACSSQLTSSSSCKLYYYQHCRFAPLPFCELKGEVLLKQLYCPHLWKADNIAKLPLKVIVSCQYSHKSTQPCECISVFEIQEDSGRTK